MKIKKNIPNFITCGNLLCGCLAIVNAFNGDLVMASYLVGIAAVLDFLDGFVARLLHVHSEIGKQLDSLADVVTFGVVPSVVMFKMLNNNILVDLENHVEISIPLYWSYIAFLIAIFSAIRLAKFNVDTRQTDSFIGLPTPANAILICSLPLIINSFDPATSTFTLFMLLVIINNPLFLIGLTIIMSYLLVAEIPLFALKFKNFGWPDNKLRYSFLITSAILLILFQFIAIPFIIFLYVVFSVVKNRSQKRDSVPL